MQIKAAIFIFFLFILLCNDKISGQHNYFTKTFTTESGLPHNHVQGIALDSTGFLWIATWDGLSRYDGYEFKNYYHNPVDSTSLAYFICNNVIVDYKNNVWISGAGGISKYNCEVDNFRQFTFNYVGGIVLDNEGKLWCNTNKGLQQWDYLEDKFKAIKTKFEKLPKEWETLNPANITIDNENRLWFCVIYEDKLWLYRCSSIKEDGLKATLTGIIESNKYFPTLNVKWNFRIVVTPEKDYRIFGNMNVLRYNSLSKEFLPVIENPDTIKNETVRKAWELQKFYKPELNGSSSGSTGKAKLIETFFLDNQNTLWQGIITNGTIQTGLSTHLNIISDN